MCRIWEFYENLDEFVYVSDMDSYELLYMNKYAREALGIPAREALAGKKCYELLQNCAAPCALCTNPQLKPGHFVKWNYYNPIYDKHLFLVDTMIVEEGRRCRIEIALDNDMRENAERIAHKKNCNFEILINNAVGIALQQPTPDETIQCFLEFLGHTLGGKRAYIFERNENGGDDNTYEWVAAAVAPRKASRQNLPPEVFAPWYRQFRLNRHIVIRKLEDLRETEPLQYDILQPLGVNSLIAVPLFITPETTAFYGIDDPSSESLEYVSGMLRIMAHFIEAAVKRRNLVRQLKEMSYRDQQTGFGNRHALQSFIEYVDQSQSLGVLFCDITGLKKVNDTQGHTAGDALIVRCAKCMRRVFDKAMLFRIGGDELVALWPDVEESELLQAVRQLQAALSEAEANMAIGYSHAPVGSVSFDRQISEAETKMYEDKSLYYRTHGIDRRRQ